MMFILFLSSVRASPEINMYFSCVLIQTRKFFQIRLRSLTLGDLAKFQGALESTM